MRNTQFILNVYEKMNSSSKIATQLLYGEIFKIQKKYKNWIKIKSSYDNYVGFIKKKNFKPNLISTHKINKLYANLYKKPNKNSKIKNKISFCSTIKVINKKNNFYKFDNYWIKKNDVDLIKKKINIFSKIKIFKGIKYKWGGKSFKGIDCSALVQIFFKYNNKFCPRNSRDQMRFFKKKINIEYLKKNNLIFWKGHVAVALSKNQLVHAYGPLKKVVIMNTYQTIRRIEKTANLRMICIKSI